MKHFLFQLFLFFFCFTSFAQDRATIDSLNHQLELRSHDTLKVTVIKSLVWEYYFTKPDSARFFARKMLSLSRKENYVKGMWDANNILGVLNFGSSQFDSALFFFGTAVHLSNQDKYHTERLYSLNYSGHSYLQLAHFAKADSCFNTMLSLSLKNNDSIGLAKAHKALGISAYNRGMYLQALQHYIKTDSLLENVNSIDKAENLQNIGGVYHALDNFDAEKKYYKEALEAYHKLNDTYGVNAINSALGLLANEAHQYDSAKVLLLQAVAYFEKIHDPNMLGNAQVSLANSYYFLKEYSKALQLYKSSIANLSASEGSEQLSDALLGLGNVYSVLGQNEQAESHFQKALALAQKKKELAAQVLVLKAQSRHYNKIGAYKKSNAILLNIQTFSDSLSSLKNSKILQETGAKYESEKKQAEIELLTANARLEKELRQNQFIIMFSIAAALSLFTVFLYFFYRNRQKTARKLEELDKMKSQFFANISHEFRTPLTLIKSPIEQQLNVQTTDHELTKRLCAMNHNVDRLLVLVDQLLDLSKLEAGQKQLVGERTELEHFFKAGISSFEYLARQKDITLQATYEVQSATGILDRDVSEKIVNNLLGNALKYTPSGGIVEAIVKATEKQLTFIVKNTGDGISKEDSKRIFERFYQTNSASDGVGIGLALVNDLVVLHKGKISVEQRDGKWTVFTVLLPFLKKESVNKSTLSSSPNYLHPRIVDEKINKSKFEEDSFPGQELPILLIVEDNSELRQLIKDLFSKMFEVMEAGNGTTGIERAIDSIPDVIISDIMMPEKDGVELCNVLKNDERTSHIPIILLTAKAGEENELVGLKSGADAYILKPFSNNLLEAKVKNLVALRGKLRDRYSQEVILKPRDIIISSVDEQLLNRMQLLLDDKLTNSDFSAEFFSHEMGMSRMQLHRKLKALTGLSTSEFIRSQRLKRAIHILTHSDIPISEVGYEVGFNDPSYFAKCFKAAYGVSPGSYVKAHS